MVVEMMCRTILFVLVAFVSVSSLACWSMVEEADLQEKLEGRLDFSPAWSPDGTFIITYADYGLHGVQTSGAQAWEVRKRKRDFLSTPVISDDGQMAFMAVRPNSWLRNFVEAFTSFERETTRIGLANVDVNRTRLVTSIKTGFRRQPEWSPDGQLLAYRTRGVMVLDRKGNPVSEFSFWIPGRGFLEGFDETSISRIAWSPKNDKIAMLTNHGERRLSGIATVTVVGNNPRTVLLDEGGGILAALAWMTDGERILYVRTHDGASSLQSINADGSGQRAELDLDDGFYEGQFRDILPGDLYEEIHVCSDGQPLLLVARRIATTLDFQSTYVLGRTSLHVVDLDSGDLRPISVHDDARFASWSPDCSRIAVAAPFHDGVLLYTMNPDGTDKRVLLARDENDKIKPGQGRPLQEG